MAYWSVFYTYEKKYLYEMIKNEMYSGWILQNKKLKSHYRKSKILLHKLNKNHKLRKIKRYINIVWPLTKHQFIYNFRTLYCFVLHNTEISSAQRALITFVCSCTGWTAIPVTLPTDLFFLFFGLDVKGTYTQVFTLTTLLQILHTVGGGGTVFLEKKKGRRWFCGTTVIIKSG